MASAAVPAIRRIPPPRIYASHNRRRSTTETRQAFANDNEQDHEKCLSEQNQLRELSRRQLIRIELLERDYRQIDDDLAQTQAERDALLAQKRTLEEELGRSSHHASANVDLHVRAQRLEKECRDLRCQLEVCDQEKVELHDIIADFETQVKHARNRQEEWREACGELETVVATETEARQNLEAQLRDTRRRQQEAENQIHRLQQDFDDVVRTKQEIVKSNYVLAENAEALREELRIARTHAAGVRMICPSSSTSFDELDESLPCLVFDSSDDDTPDGEHIHNRSENGTSSLFSEINSLETISQETIARCLSGANNDIELDLLLAKTTTLASSLLLLDELISQVKTLRQCFLEQQRDDGHFDAEQQCLASMKHSLKRVMDNVRVFDTRFRKMQLVLIASREQQQCHQAELDDFFRLVDKRLLAEVQPSSDNASESQRRLAPVLEVYEHEVDRLRQLIRSKDDTIRSCEQQVVEQQSTASRWRMKTTFLEKNQRKLLDKIKELNAERRQLTESSAPKRTRRRAAPAVQVDQQQQTELPLPKFEPVLGNRLTRSRSLGHIRPPEHGRKSRNDSGVVLNDDTFPLPPLSTLHSRRRIQYKPNSTSQFVVHTSSHMCFQRPNHNLHVTNKPSVYRSSQFLWFALLLLLPILVVLVLSLLKCISCEK